MFNLGPKQVDGTRAGKPEDEWNRKKPCVEVPAPHGPVRTPALLSCSWVHLLTLHRFRSDERNFSGD